MLEKVPAPWATPDEKKKAANAICARRFHR